MRRFQNPVAIILALAVLQVLSATYLLNIPDFYAISSCLFLLSGIGISIYLLEIPWIQFHKTAIIKKQLLLKILIIAFLLPVSYQLARHIMDNTPLQIEYADMLPIMKTMGRRWLNGHWQQVYQP